MPARKTAEDRLFRAFVAVAFVDVLALAGLAVTVALRSSGTGYLVVAACALVFAVALAVTVVRRRRHRKTWPGNQLAGR
jgi:protein-S-isoprenylcysteine O-methyltransferase Ste14